MQYRMRKSAAANTSVRYRYSNYYLSNETQHFLTNSMAYNLIVDFIYKHVHII